MKRTTQELPVAVIGAGPIGLAAAAHLAERGLPFVVFEAGDTVGASARSWGHIRAGRTDRPFLLRVRDSAGAVREVLARTVTATWPSRRRVCTSSG